MRVATTEVVPLQSQYSTPDCNISAKHISTIMSVYVLLTPGYKSALQNKKQETDIPQPRLLVGSADV